MGHLHRRLIAFDLDGTLVDSRQDLADSANALITELGGQVLPVPAIVAMVGEGARVLVERVLAAAGLPSTPAALPRFLSIYDSRLLKHTVLYPDIRAVLEAARACATVAVLTNKPLEPTERILSGLGVRGLIDNVVGGDGPHPRKPDPAGLIDLMAASGADPETTLMVGDSRIDQETARRAGAYCCVVTYGFGAGASAEDREWIAADADEVREVIRHFAAPGGLTG